MEKIEELQKEIAELRENQLKNEANLLKVGKAVSKLATRLTSLERLLIRNLITTKEEINTNYVRCGLGYSSPRADLKDFYPVDNEMILEELLNAK